MILIEPIPYLFFYIEKMTNVHLPPKFYASAFARGPAFPVLLSPLEEPMAGGRINWPINRMMRLDRLGKSGRTLQSPSAGFVL